MRCDWTTCYADAERPSSRSARAVGPVVCAFCGKPDTNKRSPHAVYSAPLDDSDHNKHIPQPLRRLAGSEEGLCRDEDALTVAHSK